MPNWCNNNVEISGPKKIIDQIEKIVDESKNTEGQGLFDWMWPMPKELRDTTADFKDDKKMLKKFGHSDWYSWATEEWGTKWDVSEFYSVDRTSALDESGTVHTIKFGFDTAWGPRLTAFANWLINNEECSLKCWYYEPGCDFAGEWDNHDDQCIEISTEAPNGSTDSFWDSDLGKTLDDYFGIVESMAEYEAEQEAEKEDVHEYTKGKAMNIGEEA